jgi:uncharacterized protein (TIGR02246 family)
MHRNFSPTLLVVAAMVVTGCCFSRVDVDAETDSLRARIKEVQAAEAAHDVEAAIAFWAEDAILQSSNAPQIGGRQDIRDFLRQFFEGNQLKEFSSTTTHMSVSQGGDLAYEYGTNRIVLAGPEGDLAEIDKFLTVWKKVRGKWLIAAVSATPNAPEPFPIGGNSS